MCRVGLLCFAACAALTLTAEEKSVTRISPVPPWPSDGNISEELKGHSVFLNPVLNEIVVVPPSPSGATAAEQFTFELHNAASPVIAAKVSRNQEGLYVYDYNVAASPGNKKPLARLSLLIPGLDAKLAAKTSGLWDIETANTDMVDRLAAKHVPLKYVHFKAKADKELKPGDGAMQIQIVSAYAHGYVTAFAWSKADKELPPGKLLQLPKSVVDEIARVTSPDFDSQAHLVLGPRFDRDTPMVTVASSFDYVMQHFAADKEMDEASQFVKTCTAVLRTLAEAGSEAAPELGCTATAQSVREREIAEAMRMSLRASR